MHSSATVVFQEDLSVQLKKMGTEQLWQVSQETDCDGIADLFLQRSIRTVITEKK